MVSKTKNNKNRKIILFVLFFIIGIIIVFGVGYLAIINIPLVMVMVEDGKEWIYITLAISGYVLLVLSILFQLIDRYMKWFVDKKFSLGKKIFGSVW